MNKRLESLSQSGFTIMELLIVLTVVIIIALLVSNNIQESVAKGRDLERRTDIDTIQDELEKFWHANEYYPADLTSLGLSADALADPSGNLILVIDASDSINKPSNSYTQEQPEQEYTYAAYACGESAEEGVLSEETPTETGEEEETPSVKTCQKYVLYSWLENAEFASIPYEKNNFHDADQ